jgi:hypothetical protein
LVLAVVAAALLIIPATASAQVGIGVPGIGIGGLGLGGGQQQLGPPPAGVLLHQQYMQLYGLPVNFTQGQITNGGGAAVGLGGYGGGFGGYPGYYGANYQRTMAAMNYLQAYRAATMYNPYYSGYYGMGNPYAAPAYASPPAQSASSAAPTYSSFGIASQQPNFGPSSLTTRNNSTPSFGGFGLSNTANPFFPDLKKDEKEEDK